MSIHHTLAPLLGAMRRRLRTAWAIATVQVLAPIAVGAALVLVVLGRFFDLAWSEPVALVVVICGVLAVLLVAALLKVSDATSARAADNGLHTRDAFASALEFGDNESDFGQRIQDRAAHLATGARAKDAVPFRFYRRQVLAAGLLCPVALILALIANPQDARRAQRALDRATIATAVKSLQAEATRLESVPHGAAAVLRLQQLIKELGKTASLAETDELLQNAAADLQRDIGNDLLAKKAATQGLEKSLENQPLPNTSAGASVQDQLAKAADNLDNMTNQDKQDLADRLDQLAAAQEAGDPAAAAALHDAAAAVRAGATSAAKAALGEAGAATESSSNAVAAGQAAGDASRAATKARAQVAKSGQAKSDGSQAGTGATPGQGSGKGSGSGSGKGTGSGSGSGSGTGGGGSPSGNVNGGGGGAAPNGGQGGKGQGTGTGGPKPGELPQTDTIFDPVGNFGTGETGTVGGGSGSGQGGTVGKGNGNTQVGDSRVSLSDAIANYSEQATAALDSNPVPPSVRGVVVSYFDQLQGRS